MKYWWVNHKQTFKQENSQGYLWSPKKESSGAKSQFYDNMRLARSGDLVVSYADGRMRAIGRIDGEAVTAPKPLSFGSIGSYWDSHGWLLPVAWRSVQLEIKPADHVEQLASLYPAKYSPINSKNGFGNQKAYLAEISKDLFEKISELSQGVSIKEVSAFDVGSIVAIAEEEEIKRLYEDLQLSDTERMNVVAARWGQGIFRSALLELDKICAVTGVSDRRLLRASHIKPWRFCNTASDRLSPENGLLLTPTFDHLFDKGLMTFEKDGRALFSSVLSHDDIQRLAIDLKSAAYPLTRHESYMTYHRQEIFLP
jgi:putative restriction endonuclease